MDGYKKLNNINDIKKVFENKLGEFDIVNFKYSYPAFFVSWKLATSYPYVTSFVNNPIAFTNDNKEIKQARDIMQDFSLIGFTIPVIGTLFAFVDGILSNINFKIFKEISESGLAVNRFREWTEYFARTFAVPVNNDLPPTHLINHIVNYNASWFNLKPKCVSLTNNCVEEHEKFQRCITLMRESQEGLQQIFKKYVNEKNFNQFQEDFYYLNQNKLPDDKKLPPEPVKANIGLIAIVLLVGVYLSNKG